jgi:subtilase family serine protease
MKIPSLVMGAVIGALGVTSFALPHQASAAAQAAVLGAADQNSIAHFNVYLPLTHQDALEQLLKDQTDSTSANYHHWLTPAQFKEQFGPSHADMATATAALKAAGFTVKAEKTQSLVVEGPVKAVEKTFSAHMQLVTSQTGKTKLSAVERHITIPESLGTLGAVVPEFTTHHSAHVHSTVLGPIVRGEVPQAKGSGPGQRFSTADNWYYANDLREAYQAPSFVDEIVPKHERHPAQIAGVGVTIGILMSSTIDPDDVALSFNSSIGSPPVQDIQAYSHHSNLPVPVVTVQEVEGGSGPFGNFAAAEASLDTQMSLGTAPGAQEILYDIPDLNDDSIIAGYTDIDEFNQVDVVSSSFGGCELDYTKAYNSGVDFTGILKVYHALFQQGNAQGITFFASSGDQGALGCTTAGYLVNNQQGTSWIPGVENPADDPNVTGVGGTNLVSVAKPGPNDATYSFENADFDPRISEDFIYPNNPISKNTWGSGGGFSQIWAKPAYQNLVNTGSDRHRAVPDISLQMGGCVSDTDPNVPDCLNEPLPRSATIVWIGGLDGGGPFLLIGTSSSSPEMAGVAALAVELNGGRLGNINPQIYALSAIQTIAGGVHAPQPFQYFHRNIEGNNNFYRVKPGQAFSEVLGNSTLDIVNFLGVPFAAPAGTPNSRSNP